MATEIMEVGEAPRLMISKIVCENFKSYAGTKILGPFHKVSLANCLVPTLVNFRHLIHSMFVFVLHM